MATSTLTLTEPLDRLVVLYDGHCRFCTKQARNLLKFARSEAIELRSFQDEGVLDAFPGLTWEACMEAMHVVTPDGRCYVGFEAAVRAVATRRWIGWIAYAYYIPGLRQLFDWIYRIIARNRYKIAGREVAEHGCEGGTCQLHFGPPEDT